MYQFKRVHKKLFVYLFILILAFLTGCGSPKTVYVAYPTTGPILQSSASIENDVIEYDGNLHIENGLLTPMLNYSAPGDTDYTNEYSDILRFCVYIETDYDTDGDQMADLVKAFVQVPRSAVEGKYLAATIYDPTPYSAGVVSANSTGVSTYLEKEFDYNKLYSRGKKRNPSGIMASLDAALLAKPTDDWNYSVPISGDQGYYDATLYDYYLIRGFAVVKACGIGTYGSEGFELCGSHLERDSHKCVVEWLSGDRVAFTDKTNNIEIKADWSNGNVAMTGTSYGGTIPYEVATTGVKGLKTIISFAGIASWYEYTNSQGVSIINDVSYLDYLSAFNCGGVYKDIDWLVLDSNYKSYLWQISKDEEAANGNYAPIWAKSDYSHDFENIRCSALIVQGLNDLNVTAKHAYSMYHAFKNAGQNVKLILHQNGHSDLYNNQINDIPWLEIQNRWLAHYLYDIENGAENMAELTVQSNVDGKYKEYDSFGYQELTKIAAISDYDVVNVNSIGLAEYVNDFDQNNNLLIDNQADFYLNLPEHLAAKYELDMPENSTISGVPEIHLRLSADSSVRDGSMISAVLIDVSEDEDIFDAYMTKDAIHDTLPKHLITQLDSGPNLDPIDIYEFVKSQTYGKCISFGWTDLLNPGCGADSSEYTEIETLELGKYYDYTFYMLPTVYTLEKGHKLKLILITWDPYRVFLDEGYNLNLSLPDRLEQYEYSYIIDNSSIDIEMPLLQ